MFTCVQPFVTPWTVASQALLFHEIPRQEYWSELPFPSPWDLSDPGIKPTSPVSLALAGKFFTTEPPGKPSAGQALGFLLCASASQQTTQLSLISDRLLTLILSGSFTGHRILRWSFLLLFLAL